MNSLAHKKNNDHHPLSTVPRHRRSFVRRDGRLTAGQSRAVSALASTVLLQVKQHPEALNYDIVFGRQAPTYLEIGFGTGQSLLACATTRPDINLIGVETHLPGIGALCLGIEANQLTNVRIINTDVVDVLRDHLADRSLDGVQIFFPDPWPKRRHHSRRLIQPDFIQLVISKLKIGGTLHLATDWEDYARHMMTVLTAEAALENLAGVGQYAARSEFRPILSKFERRAIREGRAIWELQFKIKS